MDAESLTVYGGPTPTRAEGKELRGTANSSFWHWDYAQNQHLSPMEIKPEEL